MTRWRLISLSAVAALLVGGWILVSNSQVKYRVDFTSLVKIWGDVVRDTDKIGLTLTRVSDRKEMEFGAELAKQLERSIVPDPKLQKYVSDVGQRLVKQVRRKGINYKFHLIKNTSINAFALPGGQIYVTTGMLDFATSEAELAAIIAHEINHVDLRHCIERFQYELLTRRILPSDLAAISRVPYFLFRAPYSEQQEREADVAAVIIMAHAGYHPKYGLSIDDRMAEFIKERTRTRPTHFVEELSSSIFQALEEYFKTHPSWPDRVNTIAAALQRNESKWKQEKFYVGRSNYNQHASWATLPIDDEWRPYIEPPAYDVYLSEKKYFDFKALAVHLSSGLSGLAWDEATPVAAIARAMSNCEKKIKPCKLYAVGDATVIDMTPHQVDAVISEYSISGQIARAFKAYLLAADFKALVVDPSTGRSATGSGLTTPANAIEVANGRCAEGGHLCELYAVGDVVVRGLPKEQADAAVEQYRQRVVADRITKLEQAYLRNQTYSDFKVLAVDYQSGHSAVSHGQTSLENAIKEALGSCAEGDRICALYAVGDVVVHGLLKEQVNAAIEQYRRRIVDGRIKELQKAYLDNRTYKDFKALAVDYQTGQSAVSQAQATPAKAIEEAIARCSEAGGKCELYAAGEAMVQGLPKEQTDLAVEQYRQKVMASRIEKLQQAYLDNRRHKDFKVLAVDYESGQSAVSEAQPTPSKAIKEAIAACSTQTVTCDVHAIGDKVVHGKTEDERERIARQYAREVIERISVGKLEEYLSKREFKVFVVDVSRGYWGYQFGRWHPLAALNLALKQCHERVRNCEAAFVGDTFVFDRPKDSLSGIINEYNARVAWPTEKRNPLREYMNEPRFTDFKAFAATSDGKNWQRESGFSSPYKAIEETVALCRSRNTSCELYAIGNHLVVGQPDEEKKDVTATYAREVLEKKLEFFRQPSYANFKAVAGNPDIMTYGFSLSYGRASANDAVQEALRTCSEQFTSCQIFAVGDVVVFGMSRERIDLLVEEYQRDVDASRQISH
jgi:hypothetical protein